MENKERYAVIVTTAIDNNRGDQALLWQAKKIIKDSLNIDKVYVIGNDSENLKQSQEIGFQILEPILHHPSYKAKNKKNIQYSIKLKLQWGMVAVADYMQTKPLLLSSIFGRLNFLNSQQKHTYEIIKSADAVFAKGGGFIQSFGSITDIYYIYYSLFHINLALKLNRKVFILPNSFGPFKGIGIERHVRKTLNKCTFVSTRESISKKMLEESGIMNSYLIPDMAFTLKASSEVKGLEKYPLASDRKKVAITVRPYRFPEVKDGAERYISYKKAIAGFVEWLNQNEYDPFFIEHTMSANQHEDDGYCIKEINKILSHPIPVLSNTEWNCKDLKHIYSMFDYVIGTRFHSVIFSLSEGIPSIAISYNGNKSTGIMRDIGLGDYVVDAKDVSTEKLIERFELLQNNKEEYASKVTRYMQKVDQTYWYMADEIKRLEENE